jgi:hypothetical protein
MQPALWFQKLATHSTGSMSKRAVCKYHDNTPPMMLLHGPHAPNTDHYANVHGGEARGKRPTNHLQMHPHAAPNCKMPAPCTSRAPKSPPPPTHTPILPALPSRGATTTPTHPDHCSGTLKGNASVRERVVSGCSNIKRKLRSLARACNREQCTDCQLHIPCQTKMCGNFKI